MKPLEPWEEDYENMHKELMRYGKVSGGLMTPRVTEGLQGMSLTEDMLFPLSPAGASG